MSPGAKTCCGRSVTSSSHHPAARAAYVGVMTPIAALAISLFFGKFAWGWLTNAGVTLSVSGNVLMLAQVVQRGLDKSDCSSSAVQTSREERTHPFDTQQTFEECKFCTTLIRRLPFLDPIREAA